MVFGPLPAHSPGGVAHSRSALKFSTGPSNAIFRLLHLCFVPLGLSHVSPRQQGVTGQFMFRAWLSLFLRLCSSCPAVLQGETWVQFGSWLSGLWVLLRGLVVHPGHNVTRSSVTPGSELLLCCLGLIVGR